MEVSCIYIIRFLIAKDTLVWAATTRNDDYVKLQGLKHIVSDPAHRKEFVAGDLGQYMMSSMLYVNQLRWSYAQTCTYVVFQDISDRLGDHARTFQDAAMHYRRREKLTLWSLLKQPLSELPQVRTTFPPR